MLLLIIFLTVSACHSQEKENTMDTKEINITETYFTKNKFHNTLENFNKVNLELLGIKPENLQNGYNDILIFNQPTNYQISKEGKDIKIGKDILPDLHSVQSKISDNAKYPYFDELLVLNKIIYKNDLTSILNVAEKDAELSLDLVVLFNYEKNETLLQTAIRNIQNWDNIEQNYKLAFVFYNNSTKIREKLLSKLQSKEDFFYALVFYLADNQEKIIRTNGISQHDLEKAIAFLLQLGFKNQDDVDIQTNKSYSLLNNIYVSHPELKAKFDKNKYFGYQTLEKYSTLFKLLQEENIEGNYGEIIDPDGYTNLRKEKNTSSEILQQVKSGEQVQVLDDYGDWFLIQTQQGKKGYVHKSRIKPTN